MSALGTSAGGAGGMGRVSGAAGAAGTGAERRVEVNVSASDFRPRRGSRFEQHDKPKTFGATLKRLWQATRGHRLGFLGVVVFSALAASVLVVTPLLIGKAVGLIDAGEPAQVVVLMLLAVYLGDAACRAGQDLSMNVVGQRVVLGIRGTLFGALQSLPMGFYDRRSRGDLMSRITNDVDNIATTLCSSVAQLVSNVFTICGTSAAMLALSLPLSATAVVAVGLMYVVTKVVTDRTRPLYREQQAVLGQLNGHVEECVSGLALVKAFGREREVVEVFDERNEALRETATRALTWSGYLMPLTHVVNNLFFMGVSVLGGLLAARGLVDVALMTSFLLYVRQFIRPFSTIADVYNTLQSAVAGAERVFEIVDERPEPPDAPDAAAIPDPGAVRGHIEFDHVTFGYDPAQPVLHDICLDIPAGTRVAVVGATGSGKTTLASLLTRLYDVDGGSVRLDGRDVRAYRMDDLRRAFGVVLQDPVLFSATVAENVRYGNPDAPDSAVEAAVRAAGAHEFVERLPQGYQTFLDAAGAQLSQGERQLLTVARALLADAPIFVMDEATSSVDTVTEAKIRAALLALTRGRTSVTIAHRLGTVRDSDVIVVMDEGRIAQKGTHEELLAQGGIYADMWAAQTGE